MGCQILFRILSHERHMEHVLRLETVGAEPPPYVPVLEYKRAVDRTFALQIIHRG
jgi:hypothetical protein